MSFTGYSFVQSIQLVLLIFDEFVVRLFNNGTNRKNVRFNAIQYHLWHKEIDRTSLDCNNQLLQYSIENKLKVCKKGINKYI